jgi:hypothetical protein
MAFGPLLSVEQVTQPGTPPPAMAGVLIVFVPIMMVFMIKVARRVCSAWNAASHGFHRLLDDLVKFSAVQPDPATCRTIIYFDALPF